MARPDTRDISSLNGGDIKPRSNKSLLDSAVDKLASKTGKDLVLGTFIGWIAGITVVRIGKVAAFGLGARSSVTNTRPTTPEQGEKPQPPTDLTMTAKPEPFKPAEEPKIYNEKPAFLPPKPVPHSPKISPSSIPNPSPSVSTTKQMEPGYPNYGGYLYSIPGYSAFQPVSYPGMMQPNQAPIQQNDTPTSEFVPFPSITKDTTIEDKIIETSKTETQQPTVDLSKPQTDFEEQFTPEIIPAVSNPEANKNQVIESKMSITSVAQGSGATVTIPSQINKDPNKKKVTERFSLKTSIPISKLDMKCVNNPPEPILQNALTKKASPTAFNPTIQNQKVDNASRVEIQSNVIIKNALKELEVKPDTKQSAPNQNINTLINAAEAINKSDSQFRKPEPKQEVINEIKDPPPVFTAPGPNPTRPMFNPINLETNKVNFANKPTDGTFNEQKNQILFIQNKNQSNPKMLVTIQPQSSQMLLQRNNFDSKNLQAPSRLSSQSKKCKEDHVENGMSSKVVALKRLHQENCDENDFENLITENQIYGNKIVVKEKSQGTLQEQDLKNKSKDKPVQAEPKNVVLQPNFLYLSNVQFPANLMMIKNNTRMNQTSEPNKINKVIPNENKATNEVSTMTNSNDVKSIMNNTKTQNVTASKEIHVLKSSNSILANKNIKNDIIFQSPHQKVIMNPQIVYQVPMIVNSDNKLNQPFINREYPKFITQNKEFPKQFEQPKSNDKLYIACPCQMDSKCQPKIVITNFRSAKTKTDVVSSLDIYEIRKRMRRQKYLSNRDTKDSQKVDARKVQERIDGYRNIITPDTMKAEIYKEFATTKVLKNEDSSESDSDYGEEELEEYNSIIKEFGTSDDNETGKVEFLANLRLATRDAYKEKELERQEKMLRRDSVALAYIAAGRIDRLTNEDSPVEDKPANPLSVKVETCEVPQNENGITLQKKQFFLSQLRLAQVTPQYKEDYEKTWHEIVKERKRRNGGTEQSNKLKQPKLEAENIDLDPNGQLQILTEIKKYVTDNNNLIKRRLDSCDNENEGDSIRVLAEKNFSELNRLSKMADRSVKLMTGQDTKKRDLNPGFDSENIQKPSTVQQPFQNYPQINIPNISKIISLKTQETMTSLQMTSQATSMDEPQNSAAGVTEMFDETAIEERVKDFSCQVEETFSWPGLEAVMKSYKEYEAGRKKEMNELQRRNVMLRSEGARAQRGAAGHAERARALLAERHALAGEEGRAALALQRLWRAVDAVRNYT